MFCCFARFQVHNFLALRRPVWVRGCLQHNVYYLVSVESARFAEFFDHAMLPHLSALGSHPIARSVTNEVPNNFPRLPVRQHDRVFLWLARWRSEADYDSFRQ